MRTALGFGTGKLRLIVALVLGVLIGALAAPIPHEKRQDWTSMWSEEFEYLGCRPVIFIFARETIAPGNMGVTVGPRLSNGLKTYFGVRNVATQGVNYLGLPQTNFILGGGPPVGIWEMQSLLTRATTYCPYSRVVAAGYSQGAAITHRAIETLPQYVKDRIAGVVTFGDTQTLQDGGRIRGYALNRTLIICNLGDIICAGYMWVVPIHLDYIRRVPEGIAFLITRILAAQVPAWPYAWPSAGVVSGWPQATGSAQVPIWWLPTETETLTRPLTTFTSGIPPKTTLPGVPATMPPPGVFPPGIGPPPGATRPTYTRTGTPLTRPTYLPPVAATRTRTRTGEEESAPSTSPDLEETMTRPLRSFPTRIPPKTTLPEVPTDPVRPETPPPGVELPEPTRTAPSRPPLTRPTYVTRGETADPALGTMVATPGMEGLPSMITPAPVATPIQPTSGGK